MGDTDVFPFPPAPEGTEDAGLTTMQKAEVLRQVSIFSRATVEDLFALARIARVVPFSADEPIFREGEFGDSFLVLIKGRAELRIPDLSVCRLIDPHEALGLRSVLTQEPRSGAVTAVEPSLALSISADDFYNLLAQNTELLVGIFKFFLEQDSVRLAS